MTTSPIERLSSFVRTNPALAALLGFVVIATAVLTFIAWQMRRSGAALRPLAFIVGFFGIIVLPQLAAQVAIKLGWMADWNDAPAANAAARDAVRLVVDEAALRSDGDAFAAPAALFGADVAQAMVRDARGVFGQALEGAEVAQAAIFPTGETVLAARFASAEDADSAAARYLVLLGGDSARRVVTVRRAAGDLARMASGGRALIVWTAADTASLERRVTASGAVHFVPISDASAANVPTASTGRAPWAPSLGFKLGFVALNLVVAVLFFFKGAAWASHEPAREGGSPMGAAELSTRLQAVTDADAPFVVARGAAPDELEVTWRWADARWLDLARAHRMLRTHRLLLRLDESSRAVRVREYSAAFDASVGAAAGGGAGARVAWRRERGMLYWSRQEGRVFGLQLDERGLPTGRFSSAFRFDVQEMKAPLIAATTAAGWSWRPVMLEAPAWLRWATE